MKRHIKIRILFFVIFILILLAATACGSKKKVVDKTEEVTEIEGVDKEERSTEKETAEKKETDTKKETKKETETEDFQAEIEDPTKPFELEKETKDGKTTWRGKNIKNLNRNSRF